MNKEYVDSLIFYYEDLLKKSKEVRRKLYYLEQIERLKEWRKYAVA